MEPEHKHPEVVYRRTPSPEERRARSPLSSLRGFAPALAPLFIGFLLLLGLIFGLGYLSVQQMDTVSYQAQDIARHRFARLTYLSDLRLKVVKLDNEARARSRAEARPEEERRDLMPPFELKLTDARAEVAAALHRLDTPPLSEDPFWQQLRGELETYVQSTMDVRKYSLEGFGNLYKVDQTFDRVFQEEQKYRQTIQEDVQKMQQSARRSIIKWIVLALFVGALVAVGTIWQVQRQFREVRRSMFEARRERTFTTQLLEGMVSAVAAIDEDDRIRSANAAFFRIYPKASIGASVLERFAPDDVMKILDTVTAVRVNKATYHGRLV